MEELSAKGWLAPWSGNQKWVGGYADRVDTITESKPYEWRLYFTSLFCKTGSPGVASLDSNSSPLLWPCLPPPAPRLQMCASQHACLLP